MSKLLNPLMNHRIPNISMEPNQEIAYELAEYGRTILFACADNRFDWDWDDRVNLIELFSDMSGPEFDDLLSKATQCLLYISDLEPTSIGTSNPLFIGHSQLRWIEVFLIVHSKKPPINILLVNLRREMNRLMVKSCIGKSVNQILTEL